MYTKGISRNLNADFFFKNKVAQRVHEKTEMEERFIIKAVHCTIFITVRHLYIVSDLNLFNFFVCGHFV